ATAAIQKSTSEITEHQLEFEVAVEHCSAIHAGDSDEADVQRIFVGADFRYARDVVFDGKAQKLRDFRCRQHQLEDAAIGGLSTRAAVVTQQAENDREAVVDRLEGFEPCPKIVLPRRWFGVEPIVIRGKVELADAAGDRRALLE